MKTTKFSIKVLAKIRDEISFKTLVNDLLFSRPQHPHSNRDGRQKQTLYVKTYNEKIREHIAHIIDIKDKLVKTMIEKMEKESENSAEDNAIKLAFLNKILEHLNKVLDISQKIQHFLESKSKDDEYTDLNDQLNNIISNMRKLPDAILQNSTAGKILFSCIVDERSGFQNLIHLNNLLTVPLVYPKQNNDRIIAQQGAFLLFGLNERRTDEELKKIQ